MHSGGSDQAKGIFEEGSLGYLVTNLVTNLVKNIQLHTIAFIYFAFEIRPNKTILRHEATPRGSADSSEIDMN